MQQKLDRTLGLYSALTISIGTMIGSAIFVLAGTSFEVAGPSASLSIFLSGMAAIFTAFSFAELVTFIPTAGGGYAYVRDATDNGILGFICGWGFWLGYAMSCGLFALGFGTFLNYFFPFIPQMVGAYLLIFYVLVTNIKGVKGSSKMQNVITTGLIILLISYIIYGIFFMDMSNQRPFFTEGMAGTLKAMGFLYMTYIGYGLITTASEEVIDPEKNIPRAIIISVIVVIIIKTSTFFVGAGIKNWKTLVPGVTSTPMIDTAIVIAGQIGGYLFALAGILATLSSINTAVLASSRTSYALARDKRFPAIFKSINRRTKTPIFSIIGTGIIIITATTLRDLEHISTITSIFSLTGYTLVNVALMIFRKKQPNVERKFKVPFYPITPILGIIVNMFMIFQLIITDLFALAVAVVIIGLGLVYFYIGLPKLNKAPKLINPQEVPVLNMKRKENKDSKKEFKVMVPIGHPENVKSLINMAYRIANINNGKVVPVHVLEVPEAIPLDSRYENFKDDMGLYEGIIAEFNKTCERDIKCSEPVLFLSRNRAHSINTAVKEENVDFTLVGWHHSGLAHNMIGGVVPEILKNNESTVGVLSNKGEKEIKKILYPYGGGAYSQAAANTVKKLAQGYNAEVTLLRVIKEEISDEEYNQIKEIMYQTLKTLGVNGKVLMINASSVREAVIDISGKYDLIAMGIGSQWGIKETIGGFKADTIAEKSKCSVLIVREYNKILQKPKVRKAVNQVKRL
ncbi:amino acid permease [Clostridium sp. D2Q-14]|uniref:amino acid permease n=1 Tax=Anaeromonas gelatinilytica TaxID=2683194 RepID=UPI00193BA273|nr:amino acid permease [Anaeromonas gelatinilytica]MBS4534250.1 amino acid permease [Anaeromonas gelatinilytica]